MWRCQIKGVWRASGLEVHRASTKFSRSLNRKLYETMSRSARIRYAPGPRQQLVSEAPFMVPFPFCILAVLREPKPPSRKSRAHLTHQVQALQPKFSSTLTPTTYCLIWGSSTSHQEHQHFLKAHNTGRWGCLVRNSRLLINRLAARPIFGGTGCSAMT